MQWKEWKEMAVRARGDVVIIDAEGNPGLWGGDELPALVLELLEGGTRKFVLNLDRTPYLDSPGIGGIVRAYTTVAQRGGTLKLLHVHARIRYVLEITQLASVFEMFASEEEAVQSFGE